MVTSRSRREHILHRAGALFASRGVAGTTVREIADDVGILSGSLYHHFESKEAMVDEIISSYLADLRARYQQILDGPEGPDDQLRQLIRASLECAASHPHATEIYQNDANYLRGLPRFGYLKGVAKEVESVWLTVIDAGRRDGTLRSDIDPKTFYRLTRDAVWLTVRWFRPGGKYSLNRLINDCTTLFLDGIAARR
ncbi:MULTISPECIES: TetR/AcrR family transcriptional regulator [unclassified Solwaraspora]|uniref:TetR/AcrR family transcriptional regulator n=1 Tax=unclassified Solwaraspora TaxID=2627926 RepID=UPI00248D2D63|nr:MULTISPECIES: TetR/AcrR family transcriptional regulator [unclassified Solwaraspora]WBB99646.1 TetR/AcrR family transcriptional regulator [Solwaraspora sp. WMMA2059]WBC21804.1 TetR/AcrR family transcriptional regulator [Solwaraspora sp. WMMA2080]WJK36149.1 TetR/AcrR family transcriptional regulator [Solwaraspora sp. WMMA2065]